MADSNKVVTVYGYCNYIYELSGNDSKFDPDYADSSYFDSLWDNATNDGASSNRCLWVNNNLQNIYFRDFLGKIYNVDWTECQRYMNFCKSGLNTNKLITYGDLYDDYSIIKYPKSGATSLYLNGRITELSTSTVYISLTFHDKNDVWNTNAPSAAINIQGGVSSATTYFSGSSAYYWAGGKINNPNHECKTVHFYARILMSDGSYVDPSADNYLNYINFGTTSKTGVALSCSTATTSSGTYSYLNADIPITITTPIPIEELKYPTAIYLSGLNWKATGSTGGGDTNTDIIFTWSNHHLNLGSIVSDGDRLYLANGGFAIKRNAFDFYEGSSCTISEVGFTDNGNGTISIDKDWASELGSGEYRGFIVLAFEPEGETTSAEIRIAFYVNVQASTGIIEHENSDTCYVMFNKGSFNQYYNLSLSIFDPIGQDTISLGSYASTSNNLVDIISEGYLTDASNTEYYLRYYRNGSYENSAEFQGNELISLLPPSCTSASVLNQMINVNQYTVTAYSV